MVFTKREKGKKAKPVSTMFATLGSVLAVLGPASPPSLRFCPTIIKSVGYFIQIPETP